MATSHVVTDPISTNGTGGGRALGLKKYTGEVLKEFDRKNIGLGLVKTRTISGGISAQ